MTEFFKKNKKIIAVITVILLVIFSGLIYYYRYDPFAKWEDEEFKSNNITLMEKETGKILYEKNGSEKVPPASLTKIMTTLVAIENIYDIKEVVGIDVDIYKDMVKNNASMAGFYGKEPVNYEDLLYGTMLSSGGEAAGTLAKAVGKGNIKNFVDMMNEKVKELGLENTHFGNPEGLDSQDTYTTAEDMAYILKVAMENEIFRKISTSKDFVSSKTLDHPQGLKLESTVLTPLEGQNKEGFNILGGKSGTTENAGLCWATLGEKDGVEYILVTLGAPLDNLSKPTPYQMQDHLIIFEKIERKKFFN